jgi:hypothetical protein
MNPPSNINFCTIVALVPSCSLVLFQCTLPFIWIAARVRNILDRPHLSLLLLVPDARRSLAGSSLLTTSMLLCSVDNVPRNISCVNTMRCTLWRVSYASNFGSCIYLIQNIKHSIDFLDPGNTPEILAVFLLCNECCRKQPECLTC